MPIQTKFVFSFKELNFCPSVPCQTEEAKGHQVCLICSSQKAKKRVVIFCAKKNIEFEYLSHKRKRKILSCPRRTSLSYFLPKGTKTLSLSGISLPRGEVCLIVPTKERTDLLPKQVADFVRLIYIFPQKKGKHFLIICGCWLMQRWGRKHRS